MIQLIAQPDLKHATFTDSEGTLSIRPARILGLYRVTDEATGVEHVVNFFDRKSGERVSHCNCGEIECRSLTAASCLHVLALARRQTKRRSTRARRRSHQPSTLPTIRKDRRCDLLQ